MKKIISYDRLIKYHAITLLAQFLLMFDIMVVMKLIQTGKLQLSMQAGVIIQLTLLIVVHYLAFSTVKFYLQSKIQIIAYAILIFGGFILLNIAGPTNDRNLYIISNIMLFLAVLVWQYFIIRDIFKEHHDLWYSIVGAANIYWLFIILFGYAYSLMEVFFPGMFGFPISQLMDIFYNSFRLSIHVMVGMDVPFSNIDEILSNFALFQAAVSNLYIIFVVGRLFSR